MAEMLRVVRPGDREQDTASGAMLREAAISGTTVGSRHIWLGYVELGPGQVSAVHHHGDSESGIYVISGHARFFAGDDLSVEQDAVPGDFVWVPPHVVHVEMNLSGREPVRMVVARSTQQALVFNVDPPPGWSPRGQI